MLFLEVESVILIIRKRTWRNAVFLLLICGIVSFFYHFYPLNVWNIPAFSPIKTIQTPILDPGHGGEDGGAVSPGGVKESDLNLEISLRVRDLFILSGVPTQMTRNTDTALDHGEKTIRQRKRADLEERTRLVNQAPFSVLISIHQNALPASPDTHGAQIFWNRQGHAEQLAQLVQGALNQTVNLNHHKQTREIPSSVYLMNHIQSPGILVECGFLSNAEETLSLKEPIRQKILAVSIAAGYLQWIVREEKQ